MPENFLKPGMLANLPCSGLQGQHGSKIQRQRSFPATAVLYYCMALSLYPEAAYSDVFDAVAQGLAWRCRSQAPANINASSINVAHARLSWPIFNDLQERACHPMALAASLVDAFYRALRLMAIDGSNLRFQTRLRTAPPLVIQAVALGWLATRKRNVHSWWECPTHAIVNANNMCRTEMRRAGLRRPSPSWRTCQVWFSQSDSTISRISPVSSSAARHLPSGYLGARSQDCPNEWSDCPNAARRVRARICMKTV